MSPLVSIVIPIFNRFEYAERAINSVLNQSYHNWELIIIDDCSDTMFTDYFELPSISNRIDILRNNVNSGPGYSRQCGVNVSKGDFICFLDSDDYYHEQFLSRMTDVLLDNKIISGVFCTSFDIIENCVRKNSDVSYTGILPALFDEQRPWATCSWLWRRERIVDWTIFRSNEDYLFEIGIAMKNNAIEHVSDVLCFIDKGTGVNTIDILGVLKNERDRNRVIQYCFENLDNFYNISRVITDSYVRRLFYVSARLLKLRDRGLVLANIKILHRNKKLLKNNIPFVVLYFSYYFSFINSKSAFSLLEFFRNKYL